MLKVTILLAVVTGVTLIAKVRHDMREEDRYIRYISSGKFLTETYK
jgi:hypothetical protein